MATPVDLAQLRQWVGREQCREDAMSIFPAQALAAALDRSDAPQAGDALPAAWQWLYFPDRPRGAATGPDGHSLSEDFLPSGLPPRRMWAAGGMEISGPLRLGVPAVRFSTIRAIDQKRGKSGELVFVTIDHVMSQEGRTCIREVQNLVYREAAAARAPLPSGETAPVDAAWSRTIRPDPVLLFRYSALTYNSHRIHYDRRYAVEQEYYPALVVHGPLLVTLLLGLLDEHLPEATIAQCQFRAQRPVFDAAPFRVSGRRDGDAVRLWTTDDDGCRGMDVTVTLE